MKKVLSPQEKKLLSYEKDCRNTYGESGSHSRHAIENHNNRDRRAFRRKANQVLVTVQANTAEESESLDSEVKAVHRRNWKKYSDQALRIVVERKLNRRERNGTNQSVKELLKRTD
jgi:Skp family chaperone for outer membrane proteins